MKRRAHYYEREASRRRWRTVVASLEQLNRGGAIRFVGKLTPAALWIRWGGREGEGWRRSTREKARQKDYEDKVREHTIVLYYENRRCARTNRDPQARAFIPFAILAISAAHSRLHSPVLLSLIPASHIDNKASVEFIVIYCNAVIYCHYL